MCLWLINNKFVINTFKKNPCDHITTPQDPLEVLCNPCDLDCYTYCLYLCPAYLFSFSVPLIIYDPATVKYFRVFKEASLLSSLIWISYSLAYT